MLPPAVRGHTFCPRPAIRLFGAADSIPFRQRKRYVLHPVERQRGKARFPMQSACPRHPKSGLRSGGRLRRRQEDRQNPLQPGEVGVNFKTGIDRRAFHHYQPDRHVREIAECGGSHSAGSRKEREQEKAGNSLPRTGKEGATRGGNQTGRTRRRNSADRCADYDTRRSSAGTTRNIRRTGPLPLEHRAERGHSVLLGRHALHVRRQDLHRLCRWRTGWLQALRLAGSVTLGGLYMREARCKGLRAGLPARSRRHDLVRAATAGHAALRGPLFKGLTCEHGIEFRCKSQPDIQQAGSRTPLYSMGIPCRVRAVLQGRCLHESR